MRNDDSIEIICERIQELMSEVASQREILFDYQKILEKIENRIKCAEADLRLLRSAVSAHGLRIASVEEEKVKISNSFKDTDDG